MNRLEYPNIQVEILLIDIEEFKIELPHRLKEQKSKESSGGKEVLYSPLQF